MSLHKLKHLFASFNKKKILVIGDVMVDAYVLGKVDRISPEAPVPVLSSVSYDYKLGGAANVVKNIYALGATPILISVIGNDEAGNRLLQLLDKRGHNSSVLIRSSNRKTTIKTRFISQGQHIIRIDDEDTHYLSEDIASELIKKIKSVLNKNSIDAIIFADYDKGVLSKNLIHQISVQAQKLNIPLFVDPKKRNFNNYNNIHLFKPNIKEFQESVKGQIDPYDYAQLFKEAQKFQKKYSIENLMITLSEKGVFISDSKTYYHIPAEVRDIADVSGAGDTVISTAAVCFTAGLPIYAVAAISNLAGGLVCEQSVVVPINKDALIEECLKVVDILNF